MILTGFVTYLDDFFGFDIGETNANGFLSTGFAGNFFFPTNLPPGPCLNR